MLCALVLAFCFNLVVGFSSGPPAEDSTCLLMRPDARAPHSFSPGNGSYDLTLSGVESVTDGYFNYEASAVYTGAISSTDGEDIEGYLVQAVNPAGDRIGTFGTSLGQRYLECSTVSSAIADSATLVHSATNTGSVSFTWTAPNDAGLVDFRYTIVKNRETYFGPLSASASDGIIPTTTMQVSDAVPTNALITSSSTTIKGFVPTSGTLKTTNCFNAYSFVYVITALVIQISTQY